LIVAHMSRETVPVPPGGWGEVALGLGGDGNNPFRGDEEEENGEESEMGATESDSRRESMDSRRESMDSRSLLKPVQGKNKKPLRPQAYIEQPSVIAIPVTLEKFENPKRCGNTWSTRMRTSHPKGRLTTACVEIKPRSFDQMLNTLMHELGHALGLHAHLEDTGEMMTRHDGGFRGGKVVIGKVTSRALKWLYHPDSLPQSVLQEGETTVCGQCYHTGWHQTKFSALSGPGNVYSSYSSFWKAGKKARPPPEAVELKPMPRWRSKSMGDVLSASAATSGSIIKERIKRSKSKLENPDPTQGKTLSKLKSATMGFKPNMHLPTKSVSKLAKRNRFNSDNQAVVDSGHDSTNTNNDDECNNNDDNNVAKSPRFTTAPSEEIGEEIGLLPSMAAPPDAILDEIGVLDEFINPGEGDEHTDRKPISSHENPAEGSLVSPGQRLTLSRQGHREGNFAHSLRDKVAVASANLDELRQPSPG